MKLRYLWVYSNYDDWMRNWHTRQMERQRQRGFDVRSFLLKPHSTKDETYYFPKLDRMWRRGDDELLRAYEKLAEQLQDRDVLVHYSGVNLHPDFLQQLSVLKVFICGDDPESTPFLSEPIARYYDIQLVSNIAEVGRYKSWGLEHAYFWPLGSLMGENDVADINEDSILSPHHSRVPIVFFGAFGGVSLLRAKRMSMLANAFPNAYCAGNGWPQGFIGWDDMWRAYRKAHIGWNIHNSTGPINYRTYDLPAHGVLQICDNKSYLGELYQMDKEVVGFDRIGEAIDLTRYFLAHVDEGRAIALNGWRRWQRDYSPDRVWDKLTRIVEGYPIQARAQVSVETIHLQLQSHQQRTRVRRYIGTGLDVPRAQARKLYMILRRPLVRLVRKILFPVK